MNTANSSDKGANLVLSLRKTNDTPGKGSEGETSKAPLAKKEAMVQSKDEVEKSSVSGKPVKKSEALNISLQETEAESESEGEDDRRQQSEGLEKDAASESGMGSHDRHSLTSSDNYQAVAEKMNLKMDSQEVPTGWNDVVRAASTFEAGDSSVGEMDESGISGKSSCISSVGADSVSSDLHRIGGLDGQGPSHEDLKEGDFDGVVKAAEDFDACDSSVGGGVSDEMSSNASSGSSPSTSGPVVAVIDDVEEDDPDRRERLAEIRAKVTAIARSHNKSSRDNVGVDELALSSPSSAGSRRIAVIDDPSDFLSMQPSPEDKEKAPGIRTVELHKGSFSASPSSSRAKNQALEKKDDMTNVEEHVASLSKRVDRLEKIVLPEGKASAAERGNLFQAGSSDGSESSDLDTHESNHDQEDDDDQVGCLNIGFLAHKGSIPARRPKGRVFNVVPATISRVREVSGPLFFVVVAVCSISVALLLLSSAIVLRATNANRYVWSLSGDNTLETTGEQRVNSFRRILSNRVDDIVQLRQLTERTLDSCQRSIKSHIIEPITAIDFSPLQVDRLNDLWAVDIETQYFGSESTENGNGVTAPILSDLRVDRLNDLWYLDLEKGSNLNES